VVTAALPAVTLPSPSSPNPIPCNHLIAVASDFLPSPAARVFTLPGG
jgi:hypothetical protein